MGPFFGGMALERLGGNTILTGVVRDQAELQGILQRVTSLGLTLIEVTAVERALGASHPAGRRGSPV